ncbi:MAG: hypothetical protein KME20_22120 [Kaiparowitsia implicata GSE-PSE-MK54-09C]|nr:hypothetical protein [Kaiparowitsia implicata GSE-PSE-MK54-09C]
MVKLDRVVEANQHTPIVSIDLCLYALASATKDGLRCGSDSDAALAEAIAQILQADAPDSTPSTQIVQTVTGNQNQVMGQVTGGKVVGNVTGHVTL